MNVLSLFDGISCGQVALKRAGIKYKNYYSSEIDKYAISITQKNFPKTDQLGDVELLNGRALNIGVLIGGSPCQGFSFSGNQLNFKDPRSALFWEFVRILKETKPKYFLLENVKMVKKSQDVISKALGVEPVEINSSLVSAQNRKRLYWTNIPFDPVIIDKNILFCEILEKSSENIVKISKGTTERFIRYKIPFVTGHTPKARCLAAREYEKNGKQGNYLVINGSPVAWSKSTRYPKGEDKYIEGRFKIYGKANTLVTGDGCGAMSSKNLVLDDAELRKLTPIECERLQTLPDNYTKNVSNTQRYKMIGNGWTVDVLAHIFKGLK